MTQEQEQYEQRLQKAEELRKRGIHPWGAGFKVPDTVAAVQAAHGAQDAPALEAERTRDYTVAGRLVAARIMGKASFLKLRDRSGEIQLFLKKDIAGDDYELLPLTDLGDIVAATGRAMRTRTGELSIEAKRFTVLTKALRPLPEKWHGLTDVETRYRRRYLDLVSNYPDVRDAFLKRAKLVQYVRRFLDERGFVEVETPMMHPLVSGANARPFVTHHNTLDMKLFLRIAPELYLKRLVVGGFERVYEINRNFRNEGISTRHNPEFTMLEFYQAHATYEDLMALTEEVLAGAAQAVCGTTKVEYQGKVIDFTPPFRRLTMKEAIREAMGGHVELDDPAIMRELLLKAATLENEDRAAIKEMTAGELVGELFELHAQEKIEHPTFITQFPVALSPLARRSDKDPELTDRFELYVAGREIANAFTELNDPLDQKSRFEAQAAAKARGAQEAMDYDEDYIRALEHGMPPTAGEGIGIDRLAMLFTNAPSIRDVILFPLLRMESR
jgi:lysyl-tRNA synthetase class 2